MRNICKFMQKYFEKYFIKRALFILLALQNKVAHSFSRAVDLGLHGTHWQVEFFRYFIVRIILHKTHRKEASVMLGQAVDIVLDLRALLQVYKVLLGRGSDGRWGGKFLVNGYILLTSALKVDMGVSRNGINPLSEGVFGRVAMQIYIDFDECLLEQIFGIFGRCRALQK